MKVKVIGAGAVGLTVINKLLGKAEVALIADEERRIRYSKGLKYNGKILAIDFASSGDESDLIIVAVKNFNLLDAIEDIRPFVGKDTVIFPLLNGIDAERILSEAFGQDKVLYGFITDLSANHDGLETNCFSGGGTIVFGEKDNSITPRIERVKRLFDECGQRYIVPSDIHHEKWWKFMLNTCFNTLSAILLADYASICDNDYFIRAVRVVAKEVQSVAKCEGVTLTGSDIEEMIRRVTALTDHGQTSMLQDVLANRDTENDYFSGSVSRLGKKHGIATPVCDFIHILLEAKRNVHNW